MDLGTTITGIVVILLCIIPIVLMRINNSKKEKNLLQGLLNLAESKNCQITRHDLWDNSLIGIDDNKNKVFFIRKVKDAETTRQVVLAEIQKCQVIDTSRTVSNKDGNHKVTDQVALALTYHDKSKQATALEFFNVDHDSLMLKGELLLAEKWSGIINGAILAKNA
ncbi:hypothetical protein [Adhaeribacter rhizoryzae]|uniref:Uncharacterized protein n=1 Tax=Adhaeribacter rhizoryzae TaxID=2607907 RepID=A0A5M6DPV4_9BACT|nr:hypothetical protein [Adhaeribacter rhizoryzae]KAA5549561.1 hypothetical protein F0145_02965 [Adhaeribacter rhizoryzae]